MEPKRWKISQEELDRIKREVSVAELARRRGVELKPHGKDLIGLCQFHNDTNPSLVITPDKNLWHCLGACQQGGDVIAWVMKAEGVSFRHAIEILRCRDSAVVSDKSAPVVQFSTVKKLPSPLSLDADDQSLLRDVVDYFHESLKESHNALAYLVRRKIGHNGALEQFKIGYSNRTLGYRLPERNRRAGWNLRGQLMRLGIYRKTGREHFLGCATFPIMDEHGNITEIYGRKINDNLRPGTAYHLYLPGPHKGVWNLRGLTLSKEVILCEAIIDALTFWCAGYQNVTASYGIQGFTEDHLAAFHRYGIEKVLIAYDRDEAGERAATKLAPILMEQGFEVFRAEFPDGMDANKYAQTVRDTTDALGVLLRGARWLGKGQGGAVSPACLLDSPPPKIEATTETPPGAAKEEITEPVEETNPSPLAAADESPAVEPLTPASPDPDEETEPEPPPTSAAKSDAAATTFDRDIEGRKWRVRGIERNTVYGILRLSVRVSLGSRFHLDTVDLANARHRAAYLKAAAHETGVSEKILKDDLAGVLLELEDTQDKLIQGKLKPLAPVVELSEAEKTEALQFLRSPNLLARIMQDFESIGVVGEPINALTGYLACVSRKFDDPLAIIIQSSSAAGKSALMDAILSLMPDEEKEKYTAVTSQALFYMGEKNLKHKIFAVVEEQGAEKATYALKLLQSEGKLVIASTGKDQQSGRHVTFEYKVEGPVVIIITTTNVEIDEELLNRVLVLSINEDRAQTRRIHELQRKKETLEGILRLERRGEITRRHQNAQRLLRPLRVVNPYAPSLTFLDTQLRTRRDHPKYLTLIRSIALLHQYQRPVKQVQDGDRIISYIEVTPDDIEAANQIAVAVFGRSLAELPEQTQRMLMLIDEMVTTRCGEQNTKRPAFRFSRRDVREYTGWSDTTLKLHLGRLVEMEYLIVHRGRGQSFVYELMYDGQGKNGEPFFMGLIDVSKLKSNSPESHDAAQSGETDERSGVGRPPVGGQSGGGRGDENSASQTTPPSSSQKLRDRAKSQFTARPDEKKIAS